MSPCCPLMLWRNGMRPGSSPPAFWMLFLTGYLGATQSFARCLWCVYGERHSLLLGWQLGLCTAPTVARILRTADMIAPGELMSAAERLTSLGRPRKPEIVAFEEQVL